MKALKLGTLVALLVVGVVVYLQTRKEPAIDPPQLAPAVEADQTGATLRFFVVGDTGNPGPTQDLVAQLMLERKPLERLDFVVMVGDNFYPAGVASVDDPQFKTTFTDPYGPIAVPFYISLGNHDHDGNTDAQVEYALVNEQWRMPAKYYSFRVPGEGDEVFAEFFVLDTQPVRLRESGSDAQVTWLEEQLKQSSARWRFVVGHHPAFSMGGKGGSTTVRGKFADMFAEYGVNAYFSGHDHDLQLLHSDADWLQVVSGSGSSKREVQWAERTLFAESAQGFVEIAVTDSTMHVQYLTADGLRFSHTVKQ